LDQKPVKSFQNGRLIILWPLQFKPAQNKIQQLLGGDVGVEYHRRLGVLAQLAEDVLNKGGFAGADLTGQQDKTHIFRQPVLQVGQRVLVPAAFEKIARIGCNLKGLFP
jgi:hypothetical protein